MPIEPRNACPTLADPMRTGDGYLARLPPLLASISPEQLAGLGRAALAHGNGLVEISKRGNIQLRGLAEQGGPALAAELARQGFDLAAGLPIAADPLGDRDPAVLIDAAAFASAIHARIDAAGLRLAPKLSIVLDLGTAFRPMMVPADLRFRIDGERAAIGLGGDDAEAIWIGSVPVSDMVDTAFDILARLAGRGPNARLTGRERRHERETFAAEVRAALPLSQLNGKPPGASTRSSPAIGTLAAGNGAVLAIAFPFGQAQADDLIALADAARDTAIEAIAPAAERRLLLAGTPASVEALHGVAERLGFVTASSDPRRFIAACIGSDGCTSGLLPGRRLAAAIATATPTLFDGSMTLHLSGCGKGCAHPEPATLSLVGTDAGPVGVDKAAAGVDKGASIVLEGRARDGASGFVPVDQLADGMARLGRAIEATRRPEETAGAVLDRIGPAKVATILAGPAGIGGDWDVGGEPDLGAGPRLSQGWQRHL